MYGGSLGYDHKFMKVATQVDKVVIKAYGIRLHWLWHGIQDIMFIKHWYGYTLSVAYISGHPIKETKDRIVLERLQRKFSWMGAFHLLEKIGQATFVYPETEEAVGDLTVVNKIKKGIDKVVVEVSRTKVHMKVRSRNQAHWVQSRSE